MKLKRQNKNLKLRKGYKSVELFQKALKFLVWYRNNTKIALLCNFLIFKDLFFKTKIKNYCIITGRSRGLYRKFKVSRIAFRDLGIEGLFFGLKKSS